MDATMNKPNKTHVRYAVEYGDRNYEYALHSKKSHFLRNIADVVNVLEYCVTKDIGEYPTNKDKLYSFKVNRLVNDSTDESFNRELFEETMRTLIDQIITDFIQRKG